MTTTNLFTQEDDGRDGWESLIREISPRCNLLHLLLSKNASPCSVFFTGITTLGVIQLIVAISASQEEMIRSMAKKIGMERSIPHYFHITLAYQYKDIPIAAEEVIAQRLQKNLSGILALKPEGVILGPPKLYSFDDMTAFTPWDGSISSLLPSSPNPPCFFSGRKKVTHVDKAKPDHRSKEGKAK